MKAICIVIAVLLGPTMKVKADGGGQTGNVKGEQGSANGGESKNLEKIEREAGFGTGGTGN